LRIGVIGVGRIGVEHARMLAAAPHVASVTVADSDGERAEKVAANLGIGAADRVDNLLGTVDAVVIAAATSSHSELVKSALGRGLPTFCEKPIALDLESTLEVVELVGGSGVPLQMGFQRRFDEGYRAAHDLVTSGSLGDLYIVRMAGHDPAPPHEGYIKSSGGIFRDFSIHDFDALRFVTGDEIGEVYADGSANNFPIFESHGDVDTAAAVLKLKSGAFGILSVARHDPLGYDVRMELFGSGDSVAVGWNERTPLRSVEPGMPGPPSDAYPNFQERFRDAYRQELSAFIEVAQGMRPSPCTAEDALEALRVAVACDLSREQHRPVKLEELL
jgi:myo-inositol 2-dehydrogenase / D-chiro-inositol 1-dehydrogenase